MRTCYGCKLECRKVPLRFPCAAYYTKTWAWPVELSHFIREHCYRPSKAFRDYLDQRSSMKEFRQLWKDRTYKKMKSLNLLKMLPTGLTDDAAPTQSTLEHRKKMAPVVQSKNIFFQMAVYSAQESTKSWTQKLVDAFRPSHLAFTCWLWKFQLGGWYDGRKAKRAEKRARKKALKFPEDEDESEQGVEMH